MPMSSVTVAQSNLTHAQMNISSFVTLYIGSNYAAPIYNSYLAYVEADGGQVEARECTINELARLK